MKEYTTDKIRNVALVSHNGAGKTTFVERMLFDTDVINRMGNVQQGNTVMDFEEEEIARNGSIATAVAPIEWKDHKVNVLDTPGYVDFIGEVNAALHVTEGAMVFVEAVSGVEVGTEIVWRAAEKLNMPRIVVLSKMDRDTVRAKRAFDTMAEHLTGNFVPLQLPIGEGESFVGVVDLFSMEARLGADDTRGPIPADLVDEAEEAHMALVEAAAEGDDTLMEKFFENDGLSDEDIVRGLQLAMMHGDCVPVIYCAPLPGIATIPAMNAMVRLFPSPAEVGNYTVTKEDGSEAEYAVSDDSPLSTFVFKTREDPYGKTSYLRVYGGVMESDSRVWDVAQDSEVRIGKLHLLRGKEQVSINKLHAGDIGAVVKLSDTNTNDTLATRDEKLTLPAIIQPNPIASVAIHPVDQSDVAKLSQSLNRLVAEDPTLSWHTERATHETILKGMGTTHLDIAVKKALSKFGVNMTTTIPRIAYRETITKTAQADYTHKKQTGGAGQYARVFLRLEPIAGQGEFEFDSEVFGGSVSTAYISATEKGCRQALEAGPLGGYAIVGLKAVIYDGKEHPVDSKEIAFQTAGREGLKKAMMKAAPAMLEPIYKIDITVPFDYMGDIMGDLNTRRASIQGMDQKGSKSIVKAEVPLAEIQSYTADLRSMTQGRGVFTLEFLRYGRMPKYLQDKIVAEAAKAREEEG